MFNGMERTAVAAKRVMKALGYCILTVVYGVNLMSGGRGAGNKMKDRTESKEDWLL